MSEFLLLQKAAAGCRRFLLRRGLEEVITSILVPSGAIEPWLDPFETIPRPGENGARLQLPTSPEFSLKKSFALMPPETPGIFAIARCLRDEPESDHHAREFTMVEFYLRDFSYLDLSVFVSDLAAEIAGKKIALRQLRVEEAWHQVFGTELPADGNPRAVYERIHGKGALPKGDHGDERWHSDMFHSLLDEEILPALVKPGEMLSLTDFPAYSRGMAILGENGRSCRAEVYWNGLEIANGYREIHSPEEVRKLRQWANAIRLAEGKKEHPEDRMLDSLTPAMKGVAGMAIGLERLLMAMHGISDIRKFRLP